MASVTIIVPAYNEEEVVEKTLRELRQALEGDKDNTYRITVVDDGSTDGTGPTLDQLKQELDLTVIHSPENQGYGASLKRGLSDCQDDFLCTFDADGQHDPNDIPRMISEMGNYDAVIGARTRAQGSPMWRLPGKWVLARLVNYLCDRKIPDFNCGLRCFKRQVLESIRHLCSDRFSFSTTSTMALYGNNANVKFVPIEVRKRVGKSTVSPRTGAEAFLLMLTLIMVFRPLRVFFPITAIVGVVGAGFLVYGLVISNISDVCVLLLISSLQFFLIGLLADQVARIRKEKQ